MTTTKGLRFAPIIRVSTEGQADQGESLRTQTTQIKRYVEMMGGTVPVHCWRYSGQEHATPDFERRKLDQLLVDAGKGIFDAVIVCDPDRWSRDNVRSSQGLDTLRASGVRFFVATMEYDLFNPQHRFILEMHASIGKLQARTQSLKSMVNRIERARRGVPSAGKLPYARTFDRRTETWGLNEEKAKRIRWAAKEYLGGRPIPEIAKVLGENAVNVWKTLKECCGDTWKVHFRSAELNIDETVVLSVPRILPEEIIEAIHERARSNKTYTRGTLKNHYLLGRMVFCAECGYAMFGQTNHNTRRYYRHQRGRDKPCDPSLLVPAEELERAVVAHLFHLFGDPALVEEAVQRAIPDTSRIAELREQLAGFERDLEDVKTRRKRIHRDLDEGIYETAVDRADAKQRLSALAERGYALEQERERQRHQLAHLPDGKEIRRRASSLLKWREKFLKRHAREWTRYVEMEWEDRRKLVQGAFAGLDAEGRRLGVYVSKGEDGSWLFEVRGIVPEVREGTMPMSEREEGDLIGADWDFYATPEEAAAAEAEHQARTREASGEETRFTCP